MASLTQRIWVWAHSSRCWRMGKPGWTVSEWVSEVAQSCSTLCHPMHCNLSGSSVHQIFQARVQEWIAISFSRGSSQPRDWTRVSRIAGRCFTIWATREISTERLNNTTTLTGLTCVLYTLDLGKRLRWVELFGKLFLSSLCIICLQHCTGVLTFLVVPEKNL